jgi:hypothetical protein
LAITDGPQHLSHFADRPTAGEYRLATRLEGLRLSLDTSGGRFQAIGLGFSRCDAPDGEDDGGPVAPAADKVEGNDDVGLRMAL